SPPLAPSIVPAAAPETSTLPPPPDSAPEGELPPLAPEINRSSQLLEPVAPQKPIFTLQAKRYDLSSEQSRIQRQPQPAAIETAAPLQGQEQGSYAAVDPNAFAATLRRNQIRGNIQENNNNQESGSRSLTQVELKRLAEHEVVLIIDRSASMSAMDCPSGTFGKSIGILPSLLGLPLASTSRWNWCLQQTSDLSRQTDQIYPNGITVVLFSSGFVTFPNVNLSRVQDIFRNNTPSGGTNLAEPLATQIGEYFRKRAYARGQIKPLIIGIITDGCPNNKQAVKESIIEATQLMRNREELTIIFFLVGAMDFAGERFVRDLSSNLSYQGAKYPIVKEVSFSQMQAQGLAKAIADNLQ
ncbi:MAG: hypothetical protein K2X27_09835, partial [Candidatus Obscuribacterales bacterium]|nr:hypothetical protein [Candidatus Obscuribacterales bacterium]